jgi:diphosphomevalonate decarboxylase
MAPVTARAHTNIALVKYWGKRDAGLNLPAVGSLSLTLDRFYTTTTVAPHTGPGDRLVLDGAEASEGERARVSRFLDLLRGHGGGGPPVVVTSENTVPTAAGLASSASAFAALALAGARAFGLELDEAELSRLARQGSGSAARSIFGGFVLLHRGERDDGLDCVAEPLPVPPALDVRLVVARCGAGRKKLGSTEAMERTARTSPFYAPWVASHPADLREGHQAVAAGQLEPLGEVMERSTLKMHATGLGAQPPFWYLAPATLAVMERVQALRQEGVPCWFTMDAGPHVKVLCRAAHAEEVAVRVAEVAGVLGLDVAAPGPGARVLEQGA